MRILSRTRLGYRGTTLLIFAYIDVLYGAFLVHPTDEQAKTSQFLWRDDIMPTQAWGVIWLTAAVVLAITAFMRQDRAGFAVAIGIKLAWAFVAAASGLTGNVQGAWSSVAVWSGVAALAILTSSWTEPMRTEEVIVVDQDDDAEGC